MRTKYLALFAILALFAGCEKNDESLKDNVVTFYAVGDPETKTVLVNRNSVYWDREEEVKVFLKDKDFLFTSTNNKPTLTAEFKGSFGNITREEGERVMAVYPYSAVNSGNINGATVTLSDTQRALTDTFNDDLFLSVARTTDNNWYFKNICGGVSFTLDRDDIKKIVFRGNDGESLAGTFNFVFTGDGVPVVSSIESGVKQVTLQAEAEYDFAKGHRFYIVLIPQTLKKGYTLDLYSADRLVGTVSSDNPVVIKRATWGVLKELSTTSDNPSVSLEAVDLGLSVKWANMNLGATKLSDYGTYYSWGETTPENGNYNWSNYKWGNPSSGFTKYSRSQGKTVLDPEDDAATQNLGDKWRMATIEEFRELREKCEWEKTTLDGVTCYKVTGSTGNYIYFPAYPGYYDGGITERGVNGYYWSSTVMTSNWQRAQNLWFKNGIELNTGERYFGEVIRPVYGDRQSTPSNNPAPDAVNMQEPYQEILWAAWNLGASSPEEYGDYYAWGEIETKSVYSWDTYKWGTKDNITKYNYYVTDRKDKLDLSDDVAHVKLGGGWRMPTLDEIDNLFRGCTTTWTTRNGVYGILFTSEENGNTLFVPASGAKFDSSATGQGEYSFFWSSEHDERESTDAYIFFGYSDDSDWATTNRCYGIPVRPVYDARTAESNQASKSEGTPVILKKPKTSLIINGKVQVQ